MKCLISAELFANELTQIDIWYFRKARLGWTQELNRLLDWLNTNISTTSKILPLWGTQETFICLRNCLLLAHRDILTCPYNRGHLGTFTWILPLAVRNFTIKFVVHVSKCKMFYDCCVCLSTVPLAFLILLSCAVYLISFLNLTDYFLT